MSTDASERGPPMQGRGDRAKKYWDMSKAEAAERFGLDHLVEDEEEPDASAGWREEYDHQAVDGGWARMSAQTGLDDFAEEGVEPPLEQYSPNGYAGDKARDAAITLTARTGIPPIASGVDDRDFTHFAWRWATMGVEEAIVDALEGDTR